MVVPGLSVGCLWSDLLAGRSSCSDSLHLRYLSSDLLKGFHRDIYRSLAQIHAFICIIAYISFYMLYICVNVTFLNMMVSALSKFMLV